MVFTYDPQLGRLQAAFNIANTVLPNVVTSAEFWLFLILHAIIFVAKRSNQMTDVFDNFKLDWTFVKVITAMTTFIEVFYANQCYARYNEFYTVCKTVLNETVSFAYTLRVFVMHEHPNRVRLSTRYMMASTLLHFHSLQSEESDLALDHLLQIEFLQHQEAKLLGHYKAAHRPVILLSWASVVARDGCSQTAGCPPNMHREFLGKTLLIRRNQQKIADMLALPIPFQYYHLLSIMIIMNLAMWAYGMGCSASPFAPVIFFFASLIFIGMMELSSDMADPFGTDEVDFPLQDWARQTIQLVTELLEGHDSTTTVATLSEASQKEGPLPRDCHRRLSLLGGTPRDETAAGSERDPEPQRDSKFGFAGWGSSRESA